MTTRPRYSSNLRIASRSPSLELAFKLADFFGVTIEELFIHEHREDSA
ncbi:MAG: hypothetical protein U9N43_00085 [Euryarchaeota archaeon]|nr:hypothetical protein [Euryarchaeota archaeon]